MQKDLMELIGECPVYETDVLESKGQEIIEEYRELGFVKATEEAHQKNINISKRQKIYEFEYRVITTEAIRKFLQRKVKLYDKEHKPEPEKKLSFHASALNGFDLSALDRMMEAIMLSTISPVVRAGLPPLGEVCSICEKTCDYLKSDPETIGRFEWTEVPVEKYEGLPPVPVIETFKEHKARKVFDYFTIASVNSVHDPLLLGRIEGDGDNRWFIDNWGTDVSLDDLI